MNLALEIRNLGPADIETIATAIAHIGWNKPAAHYQRYLDEQDEGSRVALVAFLDGRFVGYVTVVWRSDYLPFAREAIPEIADLNVLPGHRRRGIGSALMEAAEHEAAERASTVGLGVGMDSDYGAAQRLYARRGYVPNGAGLVSAGQPVQHGDHVRVDDNLVLYLTKELRGGGHGTA